MEMHSNNNEKIVRTITRNISGRRGKRNIIMRRKERRIRKLPHLNKREYWCNKKCERLR